MYNDAVYGGAGAIYNKASWRVYRAATRSYLAGNRATVRWADSRATVRWSGNRATVRWPG